MIGTLEAAFLLLSLIVVTWLVRFVTTLPNEDLQAEQVAEQRMKQFRERRARNQLRWALAQRKLDPYDEETAPPSAPIEEDTQEVDCEAVRQAEAILIELMGE